MTAAVRAAATGDVAAVAAVERAVFGEDAWSTASVAEELTGPRRWARVACDEAGAVVGYVVTTVAGDVADLHRVVVVPSFRRRGLAGELLARAGAAAAAAGADRMLLEVSAANAPALAFYAATGFERIDVRPRYYRDGSDALVLGAPLVRERTGS